MTITNKLTTILDRKQAELVWTSWLLSGELRNFSQGINWSERGFASQTAFVKDTVVPNKYYAHLESRRPFFCVFDIETQDGYAVELSGTPVATGNASQSLVHHPYGPSGNPISGTVSSLRVNLTLANDLTGYKVRIMSGTNAGEERTITSAIYGDLDPLSGTIYVDPPFSSAIDTTTEYQLLTGRIYINYGSNRTNVLYLRYDWATDSITTLPTNIGIDYSHYFGGTFLVSGIATSSTTSSVTVSGKNWTADQFKFHQIRFTSGVGAGQIRTITGNTNDTITVSGPWVINPDSTSRYIIETNESHFYELGYSESTIKRRNIFTNEVSLINCTTHYSHNTIFLIDKVTDPKWNDENNLLNGRYLYYFPGNTVATLYRIDHQKNTEELIYPRTFFIPMSNPGSINIRYDAGNYIYIEGLAADVSPRWTTRFNIPKNDEEPFFKAMLRDIYGGLQSNVVARRSPQMFLTMFYTVEDNGTKIKYGYFPADEYNLYRLLIRD